MFFYGIFYGLLGIAGPLIGVILAVWAVLTIWRAVTLPKRGPREPACERCKYAVAGVAGFTCPECGGDLREVGIITPRMEAIRRGTLAGAIIAWTFLWIGGGWVLAVGLFMFSGPSSTVSAVSATTTWTQTLYPTTGVYRSVELVYDSDWQSLAGNMDVTLTLTDGGVSTLTLDPGPMTVVGLEGGQTDWSGGLIERWFAESGLDLTDPQVGAAATETARVIDITVIAPNSGYSLNLSEHTNALTPSGGAMAPAPYQPSLFETPQFWLIVLTMAVGLYAVGIVLIVGRRRRLLRRGATAPATAPLSSN